ncbi:hypothetical protein [Alicyclobacillus fodiniaquatilis]|uniref:PrgI family protein n=1 Tax=Alicyclobacillus fodiniaquatilis TaxID=1661150 RepID=A0ABW4JKI4_9BACL
MKWLSLIESVYSPFAPFTAALIYILTPQRLLFIPLLILYGLLGIWHQWLGSALILGIIAFLIPLGVYQLSVKKKYTYKVFVMIPVHRSLSNRIARISGVVPEGQIYEMHWNKRFKADSVSMRELVRLIREDCKNISQDFSKRHQLATVVSSLCTTSIADVGLRPVTNYFELINKVENIAPIGSKILRPNAKWETRVWRFKTPI